MGETPRGLGTARPMMKPRWTIGRAEHEQHEPLRRAVLSNTRKRTIGNATSVPIELCLAVHQESA